MTGSITGHKVTIGMPSIIKVPAVPDQDPGALIDTH